MTTQTAADLEALKALAEKATPGPFEFNRAMEALEDAEARIRDLESALSEARKSTRTPGTVEVCALYPNCHHTAKSWNDCGASNCPVKS